MKKVMNWWLMAAVVLGISLSFTACSDDDDENKSEQTRDDIDALDNDEARTAFRWLCALTDAQTLDDNWKSKTYEPTIGAASENNEYTRVVVVNDLDDAKVEFGKLADKTPSELSGKVTVDGGAAGTMTWEPSAAGAQNLAVVTVSSRIMPHLQKLVYCTEDQVGLNGSLFGNDMKGTAYYRFGDVIRDDEGYYWVCVRPSFAPNNSKEGKSKGDSHWINIFNGSSTGDYKLMPAANVLEKYDKLEKYNGQTIILPTKLAYDREHIYNLSRLVWALIDPTAYATANTGVNTAGLGGFPYTYQSKNFVSDVAAFWNEPDEEGFTIWQRLFNRTYEEMKHLKEMNFFYMGYSWKWGQSGYVYRYHTDKYETAYSGKESNDEFAVNYVTDGFNIRYFAQQDFAVGENKPFERFSNAMDKEKDHNGYWVVRYKKGEQLMTAGKYDYYARINSRDNKMKDVYRYNEKKNIAAGANVPAETYETFSNILPKASAEPGDVIGTDGNFYLDRIAAKEATGNEPVALVVVGYKSNLTVEYKAAYKGMAIGLTPTSLATFGGEGADCAVLKGSSVSDIPLLLDGIAATEKLQDGCGKDHDHVLADACKYYDKLSSELRQQKGFSSWFIPSIGQWKMALECMGVTPWDDQHAFTLVLNSNETLQKLFTDAGLKSFWDENKNYRAPSSSAVDKDNMYCLSFSFIANSGTPMKASKNQSYKVFPFIAF